MIYLTRREYFCASHRLWSSKLSDEENMKLYGKCANTNGHGHNYTLIVTLKGKPNILTGMFINLVELKEIIEHEILSHVDHKHLNYDVPWLSDIVPTTEMLAVRFWERLCKKFPDDMLYEITLYETDKNHVTYRGSS